MGSEGSDDPLWYTYFPDDHRWSANVSWVLGAAPFGGADIAEVHRVGRVLRTRLGDDDAWFTEWTELGDRLMQRAEVAEEMGHPISAANAYLRACHYLQTADRVRFPKDELALDVYRRSVDCFHRYAALTDTPSVERVEISFEQASLPGYFVPGRGDGRRPCVMFVGGLGLTKEIKYLRGVPDLVRRGISCLVFDGPGNGEALRFRGFPWRYDYEVVARAALSYLDGRDDVDPDRIGIMGISSGGYSAPRAAAAEPRLAACVAWGALWDYEAIWRTRIESGFSTSFTLPAGYIGWVLGVDSPQAALEKLGDFRLEGVVQQLRCPFLLIHGSEDEQVSVGEAHAVFRAVGSADKTLHIFTADEGGTQHCQSDYLTLATSVVFEWLADRLVHRGRHGAV